MVKARTHASVVENRWIKAANLAVLLLLSVLGLLIIANLAFFAIHAAHLLAYPYPLDYGEGPLLQQVNLLRAGIPIWQLYADPAAPPYAVVNYPPVYPALVALVSLLTGDALLAGRLVSLVATLGAVAALWLLASPTNDERTTNEKQHPSFLRPSSFVLCLLVILSFLALPIVREWAVVMRVDMLGVALGLGALVVVQRNVGRTAVLWAVPLLLLSLFTKPSLIAAPGAAVLWVFVNDWRRGLLFAGALALGGGLLFGMLQWGSGGWFFFHIVTSNANAWQESLARGFWSGQWAIYRTLFLAAALSVALWLARGMATRSWRTLLPLLLPLCYTLLGAVTAIGVGKVGAYLNYFLELYAGLIWLVGFTIYGLRFTKRHPQFSILNSQFSILNSLSFIVILALVIGSLLRYYPIWSQNYLKLAGIIEGENPPRLVVGRYGVWQDLRREHAILATLARANAALVSDVRAANVPIFTDVLGVAAQAGQLSRIQAFEHRQLHDIGVWDQRGLLRDMANGRVPLVVLDYLGNWLTPEMIEIITHRYAQSGSRGTYDLYRPVDPGPRVAADLVFLDGWRVTGYHLAPPVDGNAYDFGETVLVTLEMTKDEGRRTKDEGKVVSILSSASLRARIEGRERATSDDTQTSDETSAAICNLQSAICNFDVVVQLTDDNGRVLQETAQPLLYGALPPDSWPPGEAVQHMQTLALPPEMLPGTYTLAVTLRENGDDLASPRPLATITIAAQGGQMPGDYFMPASFVAAWQQLGADDALGAPLMPAVPFGGFTEQCFAHGCLVLHDGRVERLPLGELVLLGDVEGTAALPSNGTPALAAQFSAFYAAHGGAVALGPPLTAPFTRGEWLVQYTRYARLEQSQRTGETRLASLGVDYLRLPGGVPYRWP